MNKTNKVKPTVKQLAALEIMKANPRMSKGEAMRKAGYSDLTSRSPKQNLLDLPGTEVALDEYQIELAGLGLTHKKVAQKINQFIDAKKPFSSHTEPDKMIDDWQTQIKAVEMLRGDLDINKTQDSSNLKRRIVAEEFFMD